MTAFRSARWLAIVGAFCIVLVAVGATAAPASASNRCTRYVGNPSGVFLSSTCPALTSYGTISQGAALWSTTSSVAYRDENYIQTEPKICIPQHLHLRYSNGTGDARSMGCVYSWIWYQGNGGQNVASWCGVHDTYDTTGIATFGQCYTKWTY